MYMCVSVCVCMDLISQMAQTCYYDTMTHYVVLYGQHNIKHDLISDVATQILTRPSPPILKKTPTVYLDFL